MNKNNPKLFVVSAPSGCGKGTILSEVFKHKNFFYSVSCTTRKLRDGEIDGVHYNFVDDKTFQQMIENNEFLEYAGYVSHYYGTPVKPVNDSFEKGIDVILEIETEGALNVKAVMPEAVLLFILPPSVKELKRRLKKRGTESENIINERIAKSVDEIKKSYNYDYVIMNDALEDAVEDFLTVIDSAKNDDSTADRFKTDNEKVKKMIDEVLKNA